MFENIDLKSVTISQKDKLYIQFGVGFLLIVFFVMYVLLPTKDECEALEAEIEQNAVTQKTIERYLNNDSINENMEITIKTSDEYYDYFYGVLNSYTVDGIITGLVESCGLNITSLTIGDYETVDSQVILKYLNNAQANMAVKGNTDIQTAATSGSVNADGTDNAQLQFLTSCNVNINVTGTYNQLMRFIDSLNKKSDCLVITQSNISKDSRYSGEGEENYYASFVINIFGIDFSTVNELTGENRTPVSE